MSIQSVGKMGTILDIRAVVDGLSVKILCGCCPAFHTIMFITGINEVRSYQQPYQVCVCVYVCDTRN